MKKKLNLIIGLVFTAITAIAFYWLWSESNNFTTDTTVADNLQPVEIETVKSQAESLLAGLENKSNLPLSTPTTKMGTDNLFK